MDFGFSPEQDAMRESVRRFMRERVAPRVAESEKQREFAWDLLPQLQPFGYLGGLLPEEAGGFGMRYADWAILMEEAGYCWLSLRVMMNSLNILAQLLHRQGTPEQQQRYLKPLLAGQLKHWIIERIFRDTRGGMIPEGTTEIQTLIIGREVLGVSAFH